MEEAEPWGQRVGSRWAAGWGVGSQLCLSVATGLPLHLGSPPPTSKNSMGLTVRPLQGFCEDGMIPRPKST